MWIAHLKKVRNYIKATLPSQQILNIPGQLKESLGLTFKDGNSKKAHSYIDLIYIFEKDVKHEPCLLGLWWCRADQTILHYTTAIPTIIANYQQGKITKRRFQLLVHTHDSISKLKPSTRLPKDF